MSYNIRRCAPLSSAGIILFFAFACAAGEVAFQFKGVAYVSFQNSEYLQPESTQSLDAVATTGANYVSILATWYMPSSTSNEIVPDPQKSPSDDAVRKAIRDAHARGLKVMLKPHVDVVDGTFRGLIAPANKTAWFSSYQTFIAHYAQIAQSSNCELFCVGCELKSMSGAANLSSWSSIITAIRQTYTGPLTYAANAFASTDEFSTVAFWSQLDFAGLDVYTPLTSGTAPTVSELIAAWTINRLGQNQLQALRNFAANVGKPVLFTEIGYQSSDGTNINPNAVPVRSLDLQEQADCYQAALTVWGNEAWLQGMFFWGWEATPIDSTTDSHFSPRGKPAQTVLASFYQSANRAPIAGSGILATPALPKAGDAVQFSSSAADADGDALGYAWDFGNGSTSSDAMPSIVFAAPGTYQISVTVSDGKGGSVTSQLVLQVFADFQALTVKSCTINLNFARASRDSIRISGALPLDDASTALSAALLYNFGGISGTLTLDARGKAANEEKTVSIKVGPKSRKGQTAFSLALSKSALAANLADEGLINADAEISTATVSLVIQAGNIYFQKDVALVYSAKAGKTGRAKASK